MRLAYRALTDDALPPADLDVVNVWSCSLAAPAWRWSEMNSWLDAEEAARLHAIQSPDDRRRFVAAHGQLRGLLGYYLEASPRDIQFRMGPHGKPELIGPQTGAGIHFNLSHSGEEALIAVTRLGPVGIDVQAVLSGVDWRGLALRFFSPDDVQPLERLAEADAEVEFYRRWVEKEATAKAMGHPVLSWLRRGPHHVPGMWSALLSTRPPTAPGCVALAPIATSSA